MNTLFKFGAVALCLFSGICALAQETNDYYKFDNDGYLCVFQKTLPDGVIIKYKSTGDVFDLAEILYPDGTIVDYKESLTWYGKEPRVYLNFNLDQKIVDSKYGGEWVAPLKDWYKSLRKESFAPTGRAIFSNLFDLQKATIINKDNSQVSVYYHYDEDIDKNIRGIIDVSENGDRINWTYGEVESVNLKDVKVYNPESGSDQSAGRMIAGINVGYLHDGRKIDGLVKDVVKEKEAKEKEEEEDDEDDDDTKNMKFTTCKGQVISGNGNTFSGRFSCVSKVGATCQLMSPYLQKLIGTNADSGRYYPSGIVLCDGNTVNKENKIVAMYRDCKQLDEFDMAAELAAKQGEIDKQRAAAKAAANEKKTITTKYGSKYADAFFAGNIIVGMPWSLVQIGLDAHSFKNFYSALLSMERESAYGKRQLYSLVGDDLTYVGHMWVANGAVESITYY